MSDDKKKNKVLTFGARLKQVRQEKGLSGAEMARRLGMVYTTYMGYENNRKNAPKLSTVKKMASALGVDYMELMPTASPVVRQYDVWLDLVTRAATMKDIFTVLEMVKDAAADSDYTFGNKELTTEQRKYITNKISEIESELRFWSDDKTDSGKKKG